MTNDTTGPDNSVSLGHGQSGVAMSDTTGPRPTDELVFTEQNRKAVAWQDTEDTFTPEQLREIFPKGTLVISLLETCEDLRADLATLRAEKSAAEEALTYARADTRAAEASRDALTAQMAALTEAAVDALTEWSRNAEEPCEWLAMTKLRNAVQRAALPADHVEPPYNPRGLPPCLNCGHIETHDGPCGDVADGCTHPGCVCGFDSRAALPADAPPFPAQVDLPPDAMQVLYDNLPTLYETCDPPAATPAEGPADAPRDEEVAELRTGEQ